MEAFDQLDLVAEISATLLGFIAVFLVLSKEDGRFSGSDRHFVQSLVMTAAFAIVVALAPRAFRQFLVEAMAWQSATILAIVLGVLSMYLQARHQQEMSPDESSRIHWLWHLVAWGLASSCAVLLDRKSVV